MSVIVDIVLAIFILLGTYAGARKGLIKSLVGFIGLVAIIIVSYALKDFVADFLIDVMPFFNFSGDLEGLTSLNILIYNVIAFIVVFIVLYSVLNIVISVTNFIDTLLKFTVIWVIPSKIGGAIIGFLESWLFIFLVVFVLSQFSFTNIAVRESTITDIVLNYTPVIGDYLGGAADAAQEIYEGIDAYRADPNRTTEDLNLYILQIEVNYGLISKEKATELMETGKIGLENVLFGKIEGIKWSNI